MNPEPMDTNQLDVRPGTVDLRRDVHLFVQYIRERPVKRSHRGNVLSKADSRRLACSPAHEAEVSRTLEVMRGKFKISFADVD